MQVIEEKYFSKKIVLLNWILTMLIVLLHGNPVIRFGLDMNTDSTIFIKLLFSACQVAVPLFFLISAILFYRTCTKFDDLKSKLRRRIKSLLIPYLLWNTLFVGIFFLLPLFSLAINEKIIDHTFLYGLIITHLFIFCQSPKLIFLTKNSRFISHRRYVK